MPWSATIKLYQIILCRGVSYDSVVAGFTGVSGAGWIGGAMASPPDPRSKSDFEEEDSAGFGDGASGLASSASTSRGVEFGVFASAVGGVEGVRGASTGMALQQNSTSAVNINDHLSHCRPGKGAGVAATPSKLLYHGTGVTGPLVLFSRSTFCSFPDTSVPTPCTQTHCSASAQELL